MKAGVAVHKTMFFILVVIGLSTAYLDYGTNGIWLLIYCSVGLVTIANWMSDQLNDDLDTLMHVRKFREIFEFKNAE